MTKNEKDKTMIALSKVKEMFLGLSNKDAYY